jgi:transcription initiation factor TFIID subunit 3
MTPPPPLFHALLRPAVLQILRATGYHSAKTSVIDSVTDLAARYFLHLCQLTAVYAAHNNEDLPPSLLLHPAHHLAENGNGSSSSSTVGGEGDVGGGGGDGGVGGVPAAAPEIAPAAVPAAATATATATTGSGSGSGAGIVNPVIPAPTIVDVRMALQRSGALLPERLPEEQEYLGEEDMRGVENFVAWAMGSVNREIKRIALDGVDEAGDYLDGEFFFPSFLAPVLVGVVWCGEVVLMMGQP